MAVVLRSDWAANVRNNCIDASAYAYRFQREPHAAYDLVEEIEPYFKKSERLTAEEISEIEKWPDTVSELFGRDESKGTKDHFLKCLRGVVDPETPTERICTKLIHQALAMGGLHCRMGEHEYAASQLPEVPPSNDVVNLKTRPLRSFLLGVQKDMSELVCQRRSKKGPLGGAIVVHFS